MTSGIINVLKPPGMTSHDVVSFVRRAFGLKKVGHAGTLDPAAAGVLPVFLGSATRLIEYTTDCDKEYRVELTFGYATDTGDDTGEIIAKSPDFDLQPDIVNKVIKSFRGKIKQLPPMHSAIKIDGKKLYEYARQGLEIERQPRDVEIYDITILKMEKNLVLFDVNCSKGTYIRSLCTDIGNKLGIPAVMSFLVRTRVGSFTLSQARTLEEITALGDMILMPPEHAITQLPKVQLTVVESDSFVHGQNISLAPQSPLGTFRVYDAEDHFIGIGVRAAGTQRLQPAKVLI
jgi:tRNA pseudouridine55 synthase